MKKKYYNSINFIAGLFRKFSYLPIFRILGRLTYGAFVIHIFVARIVLGTLRTPLYFGPGIMVSEIEYLYFSFWWISITNLLSDLLCTLHVGSFLFALTGIGSISWITYIRFAQTCALNLNNAIVASKWLNF